MREKLPPELPGEGSRLLPRARGPQERTGYAEAPGREELELGRRALAGGHRPLLASPAPGGDTLLPQVLTALDRDASCRKHKLRQKLEQIISLVSGNS